MCGPPHAARSPTRHVHTDLPQFNPLSPRPPVEPARHNLPPPPPASPVDPSHTPQGWPWGRQSRFGHHQNAEVSVYPRATETKGKRGTALGCSIQCPSLGHCLLPLSTAPHHATTP